MEKENRNPSEIILKFMTNPSAIFIISEALKLFKHFLEVTGADIEKASGKKIESKEIIFESLDNLINVFEEIKFLMEDNNAPKIYS